jgi:hypothetical protein
MAAANPGGVKLRKKALSSLSPRHLLMNCAAVRQWRGLRVTVGNGSLPESLFCLPNQNLPSKRYHVSEQHEKEQGRCAKQ